jgi:hypothetical protein
LFVTTISMDDVNTDVIETPPSFDASLEVVSAPADSTGENAPQTAEQAPTTDDKAGQAEAAFQVPENDDDLKGKENDPQVQAIIQMRGELRERNQRLDSYKPLDSWRPLAESIGDPALAQSAHELVSAIHTPDTNNPSGFTSRPFLERLETESPGAVDQLFSDTLTLQIQDPTGNPTTVVRELVKSWGLDPDRFDDYRSIDTLRASGIVTAEDISKIPEKYHSAFKSLSSAAREDLLAMRETNPVAMEEYLRNANDALEARTWREKDETAKREAQQAAQVKFEQDTAQAVDQDIVTEIKAISDSVHQILSSQFTFSSDATVNDLEHTKILSVLGNLQSPYPVYRDMAVKALKAVGVEPNGFEELANRLSERREAYVRFNAMGDKMQAGRALSEATFAKQQILAKVNDYASRLAKASGQRAATAAAAQGSQLAAASGRFVPTGNGQVPQGTQNPYEANPHQIGSQEYYAFNRKVDKEYSLTNASVFGG